MTKVWAPPHSQLDCPVAFPEDGIRGSRQSRWHRDAADGFAILVRLLSEAKCQNAASRHLGLSTNWTLAMSCTTTTAGNGAHPVKTAAEFGQWPNASNGRAKRKRTQKRGLMITLTVLVNRGARHVRTNFRETFRYFGSCPSFGRDARFSCERADQL